MKPQRTALIPGAYDRTTLTHRQPGSMGGGAFGSADMPIGPSLLEPIGPSLLDAATIAERELEGGGGGVAARRRKAKRGPALRRILTGWLGLR